jgi:hypothetical protein
MLLSRSFPSACGAALSDEETQLARLLARPPVPPNPPLSHDDAVARMRAQMPLAEKVDYATAILRNNGSVAELRTAVAAQVATWRLKSRRCFFRLNASHSISAPSVTLAGQTCPLVPLTFLILDRYAHPITSRGGFSGRYRMFCLKTSSDGRAHRLRVTRARCVTRVSHLHRSAHATFFSIWTSTPWPHGR